MKRMQVTLADIETARQFLGKILEPTPLLRNQWLSKRLGCDIYLKLENMQPIGSFKIRGATYKISHLSKAQRSRGVICASAGNHAQGVAWGSRYLDVKATIVMPENAPLVKIQNTRALGAKIILAGHNYDEAYQVALKVAAQTGAVYVHAFEDNHVIAGQGTIGLEIFDQLPDVDVIIASMGGGGMIAGTAIAVKSMRPSTKIIGCQAQGAPSLVEAVKKNRPIKADKVETFADGIAVAEAKTSMMHLVRSVLDDTYLADDEAIAEAMLLLLEKGKTVAEASGALPLAIAEKIRKKISGKKVVLVISGGNVDVNVLGRVIDRGLIKAGRRVRVNVYIPDIPGSLSHLTTLIASQGANVLQAIHDRSEITTGMDETGVELTLETRGPEHTARLMRALKKSVRRIEILH